MKIPCIAHCTKCGAQILKKEGKKFCIGECGFDITTYLISPINNKPKPRPMNTIEQINAVTLDELQIAKRELEYELAHLISNFRMEYQDVKVCVNVWNNDSNEETKVEITLTL